MKALNRLFVMPMLFATLLLMTARVSPAAAAVSVERPRIYVECALRFSSASECQDFKNSFFQKHDKFIDRLNSAAGSDLELKLTDELSDSNHVRYTYSWTSHLPNTPGSFAMPLELSTAMDSLGKLNLLTLNAAKGLFLYLKLESETVGEDGSLIIVYRPAGAQTPIRDTWMDRLAKSPLYVSVSMNGFGNSNGTGATQSTHFNGSTGADAGYLKEKYKVTLAGTVNYQTISTPTGDGSHLVAKNLSKSANAIAVYSLSRHWSVALINVTETQPGSNVELEVRNRAGVEWTLVPFRSTENQELAFQVGPSFTSLNLRQPNELQHLEERYFGAFARIYYYWVTCKDKLTMSATAGSHLNLKYPKYYSAGVGGNANYQINRAIGVNGSISYHYSKQSLTYPAEPDYSNPVQTMFLGGQAGSAVQYNLGINVTVGNSLKRTRDRRWSW